MLAPALQRVHTYTQYTIQAQRHNTRNATEPHPVDHIHEVMRVPLYILNIPGVYAISLSALPGHVVVVAL